MATDDNLSQAAVDKSRSGRRFSLPTSAAIVAAVYAIVAGAVTLLGWSLGSPRLTDWSGTGISMFPNTAVCASLSGAGLLLLSSGGASVYRRRAIQILALAVAFLGALTLFQHLSGVNLGIDTLLFNRPWGQRAAASPMRMGPPASTSFLILGVTLLLATAGPRWRRLASALATLPIAIASLSLIGYGFGSDRLYTVVHLTGIAFQTSTIIAALGVGMLAGVPEHGLVALLYRNDAGGMLVRRLLLPIVVIPLFIGWLRLLGQQAGYYDTPFGLSMVLLTTIAMLLALLTWTASSISRAAGATRQSQLELEAVLRRDIAERKQTELALREREHRYELVLLGAEAAIWDWDVLHQRVLYSPRWKQLRGLSDAEVSDREEERSTRIHPQDYARVMAAVQDHFEGRTQIFREEYRVRHKDGHWIWVLDRGIARRDESGRVVRMAGSESDITERKQLEDQLRLRLEELAERDQRKNEFLATLAHELRNPLAPIRNSLQLLRMSPGGSLDTAQIQEIIERQVNHMVRLVDDLLEVSRITNGKIELRPERVEIAAVLQSAVETSKPLMEQSGHEFTLSVPAEPLTVVADPVRLAQVVANLLNNAAKYTEAGGKIRLSAARHQGEVAISVSDTGVGISPEMFPQLFRMFSQADRDHKRSQGGLGIGLALARSLVEMQGGRIEARSDGEGCGAEFIIHLPLAKPQSATALAGPHANGRPGDLSTGSRVLVVDDNQDAALSLAMLLSKLGNEVQTAHDGPAALEAIQSFRPSVVLLDLGMPGMSGYEVAERTRAMPGAEQCVLIALTGWGQEDDRRRTREAGFKRHLVKPVDLNALKVLLAELQAESRANHQSRLPV